MSGASTTAATAEGARSAEPAARPLLARLLGWCTVPLVVVVAAHALHQLQRTEAERDAIARRIAQRVAASLDLALQSRTAALHMLWALARRDDGQLDLAELWPQARAFRANFGDDLALLDAEGRNLLDTRRSAPHDDPALLPVATLQRLAAHKTALTLALPVVRAPGEPGSLVALLRPAVLQQALGVTALPEGWALSLRDGAGRMLAQRGDAAGTASTQSGRYEHRLERANWIAAVEIPDSLRWAPRLQALGTLVLAAGGAALLVGAGSAWGGRRLQRANRPGDPDAPGAWPAEAAADTRYRHLFDAHPQPLWVYDTSSLRILDANAAALERYGYSAEEALSLRLDDLLPPAERAPAARALQLLHAIEAAQVRPGPGTGPGTGITTGIQVHRRRDGRLMEVELLARDIEFDGRPARLVQVQDATLRRWLEGERASALAAAREAHARLAEVTARIGDGIVAIDTDWRFTYVNPRAARLIGQPDAAPLVGRGVFEVLPGSRHQPWVQTCEEALHKQRVVVREHELQAVQRWFEWRVHPSSNGLSIYLTDTTDRRRAEAALRARERDFRLLAEQIPGIVYRARLEPLGLTEYVSPRIAEYGYTPEQWLADPQALWRLIHPDDRERVQQEARAALEGGAGLISLEYRLRNPDGSWRHVHDRAQVVRAAPDEAPFLLGVSINVTDRLATLNTLRASQAELSALARRLLDQERETTARLAQVLHDRLGPSLAAARLHLQALPPADAASGLHAAGQALAQAEQDLRHALVELRPALLDEAGLGAALAHEIALRRPAGGRTEIWFEPAGDAAARRWPAAVEYGAFMVAREALVNALQHADAALIRLRVAGDARHLALEVLDDGGGIDDAHCAGRAGHLGITGMRERAHAIGARLAISAAEGGGTAVRLHWEAPA